MPNRREYYVCLMGSPPQSYGCPDCSPRHCKDSGTTTEASAASIVNTIWSSQPKILMNDDTIEREAPSRPTVLSLRAAPFPSCPSAPSPSPATPRLRHPLPLLLLLPQQPRRVHRPRTRGCQRTIPPLHQMPPKVFRKVRVFAPQCPSRLVWIGGWSSGSAWGKKLALLYHPSRLRFVPVQYP